MCRLWQPSNVLIQAVSQRAAAEVPAEARPEATATDMVQSSHSTHKVASVLSHRCRREAVKAVRQQQLGEQVHKGFTLPGPLGCKARAVRQVAGPMLAMPCMSLRVFVMLKIFLLMRVSAPQPARLARAKDSAQGSPLKKEDF